MKTTTSGSPGSADPASCRTAMELLQHNGHMANKSPTLSLSDVVDLKTNIIINYLPQTMSQDDVHSLFSTIGDVESCKLVRDKSTGQSLGYGFVNYKQPESARKAIESLNGLRLQNKTIKVSYARPSSENIKGANLYISGLPKTMGLQDMERTFSACGKIISARIICDSYTGLSKGVGFVRYDTRQEAEQAIKHLNGTIPAGSTEPVTVKFANSPTGATATTKTGGATLSIPGVGGTGVVGGPGGVVSPSYLAAAATAAAAASRRMLGQLHNPAPGKIRYSPLDGALTMPGGGIVPPTGCTGWCLFVYNLAPETEENVLWQLFGPFGAVQNVKVMRDFATQKCKGYGFVTMTNYDEALSAVAALNGFALGTRVLQVSFKKSKNSTSVGGSGPAGVNAVSTAGLLGLGANQGLSMSNL